MFEARKYNPENITPDHFLIPPTLGVSNELAYLSLQMASSMESKGRSAKKRVLRVGTEFEVYFFSPRMDPTEALAIYADGVNNPNYGSRHQNKVTRLTNWAECLNIKHPKKFSNCDNQSSDLMIEFRTAPQAVTEYLETIDTFRRGIVCRAKKCNVWPVVHSQHIHVSYSVGGENMMEKLLDPNTECFCEEYDNALYSAFSRVLALVLLPEEYYRISYKFACVENGDGENYDNPRTEVRLLSSEYACDPYLNLALALRAVYGGIVDKSLVTLNKPCTDFSSEVCRESEDSELEAFFGKSTLLYLTSVMKQYPDVSTRKISVDQVKKPGNEK